jgi:hypothetical protein
MPANYVLLEKIVVGAAGAATVVFNSIPQTGYTDLVVKVSARVDSASATQSMAMAFNAAAQGSVWSQRWVNSDGGSGTGSGSYSGAAALYPFYVPGATATTNTFGNGEIYITNYSSTTQNKTVSVDGVTENNASGSGTQRNEFGAMLFAATNAVTSITLYGNTNFVAGSSFYLYGVAKLGTTPAIVPYATGGDTIMTDGTYWYHAFRSSGTFTPAKGLSCDVLVVAGGGGGGLVGSNNSAGGGGAGQITYSTSQSLGSGAAYTTTIGGGGAASVSTSVAGSQGTATSFAGSGITTITATGGGGGGSATANATLGGSGGGGSSQSSPASSNGANTNAGTAGFLGTNAAGGSGGGAGGVGTVGTNSVASNGGAGLNTWSTWLNTTGTGVSGYIAGGGAGGYYSTNGSYTVPTGGSGGGGNGGYYSGGTIAGAFPGVANTGSGGGAYGLGVGSGAGGSGLVIVRYAV